MTGDESRDPPSDADADADAETETETETVVPCDDLDEALAFLTGRLGFRLDAIFPADSPRVASVSGHGLRLRLVCGPPFEASAALPPLRPSFVLTRAGEEASWVRGRAGMRYRDLVPDRQGGRTIASHIQLREGGPVADYVHFHEVRYQVIFCRAGWVRVVYEDQGAPFVLRPGDCVLQPPRIRHRVLESSAGAEVIEVGSPASHETFVEHELELPNDRIDRARLWRGQRFVHHVAAEAPWRPWQASGFEARDTGIAEATGGLADVRVLRAREPERIEPVPTSHDGELLLVFVLEGEVILRRDAAGEDRLAKGDACVIPRGMVHAWSDTSTDLELLRVEARAGV
jgi:quercetin dioxygenase-like cupin family protein